MALVSLARAGGTKALSAGKYPDRATTHQSQRSLQVRISTEQVHTKTQSEPHRSFQLRSSLVGRDLSRKVLGATSSQKRTIRTSQWEGPVATGGSGEYDALKGIEVYKATTGEAVPLLSLWDAAPESKVVVAFLTHFADLSSWEYAQKLTQKVLPALQTSGSLPLVAVGLGSVDNARKFSEVLNFPLELLYADPDGACYKALGFSEGFGKEVAVSPYLKLLPMLMGIGSPGTIQEVFRGYVGDRSSKPVFAEATPFDILGTGYQRPFELATLRLFNMAGILPKWGDLCPPKTELLTQQGGTLVFRGEEVVFKHMDSGILKYTDVEMLLEAVEKLPVDVALPVAAES